MLLFIDSANCAAIRQAAAWGVISGVTTNPALIAQEGRPLHDVITEIAALVDGPISAEVEASTTTAPDMIREARAIARIHPNLVVKLPLTAEGLKACHACHKEGIRTNMTLVFSAGQALLAARAGASYVSPFIGRLDDIAEDGVALVQDIIRIFAAGSITTRIICASIRHPAHVLSCARAGADIATVPYRVIEQMIHHPLTDQGLAQFQAASLQAGRHS